MCKYITLNLDPDFDGGLLRFVAALFQNRSPAMRIGGKRGLGDPVGGRPLLLGAYPDMDSATGGNRLFLLPAEIKC